MRLLLVEDDHIIGDGISAWLSESGHAVDWLKEGTSVSHALSIQQYDMLILDLNLPGISGLELLKKIRAESNDIYVLILTARDTVEDRVKGLDAGADDYLVKPFDLNELSARIRALSRRRYGKSDPLLCYKTITLDLASHTAYSSNEQVDLSNREFSILQLFIENAGKVLSRNLLEEKLYGWGDEVSSNTIEVHIHHLRKKFGQDVIKTIRGVGYLLQKET